MKRLLAVFQYLDDAQRAYQELKSREIGIERFFSPVPVPEIEDELIPKASPIRWIVLFGSLAGISLALLLTIGTSVAWPLVVGGKPIISVPPFVVITFELMVLVGSLANLLGLIGLSRLPRRTYEKAYDPRFSNDRFGILVKVPSDQEAVVREIFETTQAEEIHEVA